MYSEEWGNVDSNGVIRAAQYRFPGGASRSLLIKLSDHSYLVYSPGKALVQSAMRILDRDTELLLLAPNSAHSLGLDAWKAECVNSRVVASSTAAARLLKRSSLEKVDDLSVLESKLPAHIALHTLPMCNWGEVWLSIDVDGRVHWAVCDAFFNLATLPANFLMKSLMKLGRLGPDLEVSRAFRFIGIRDKNEFREWAIQRFSNGRENVLIPCHGDIYDRSDLTDRIVKLLKKRF